ncbi:hypothetical protein HYV30_00165 [Candidatus Kaiserbacteria bacterium]|nr:hypothetical protein [Candidatus Kaiserbacteria bacterium]
MKPLAKVLGSAARLKTLRLFIFNQTRSFAPAEIALRLKLSRGVVHQELSELSEGRFLKKKGAGASARYQVNPRYEHLPAFDTFIRDTTSVRPQHIVKALKHAGTVRLIALSGLFTSVLEAQIDLLVVGDHLEERTIASAVRSLEAELGREIRYASFATADFRYRLGAYDRLLRDVFDYPHRLLIDKIGL